MGGKDRSDGVEMFVAEKSVDSVVKVERHSERVSIPKMVLDNSLMNVVIVYAPHSGKPKYNEWNGLNKQHQHVNIYDSFHPQKKINA